MQSSCGMTHIAAYIAAYLWRECSGKPANCNPSGFPLTKVSLIPTWCCIPTTLIFLPFFLVVPWSIPAQLMCDCNVSPSVRSPPQALHLLPLHDEARTDAPSTSTSQLGRQQQQPVYKYARRLLRAHTAPPPPPAGEGPSVSSLSSIAAPSAPASGERQQQQQHDAEPQRLTSRQAGSSCALGGGGGGGDNSRCLRLSLRPADALCGDSSDVAAFHGLCAALLRVLRHSCTVDSAEGSSSMGSTRSNAAVTPLPLSSNNGGGMGCTGDDKQSICGVERPPPSALIPLEATFSPPQSDGAASTVMLRCWRQLWAKSLASSRTLQRRPIVQGSDVLRNEAALQLYPGLAQPLAQPPGQLPPLLACINSNISSSSSRNSGSSTRSDGLDCGGVRALRLPSRAEVVAQRRRQYSHRRQQQQQPRPSVDSCQDVVIHAATGNASTTAVIRLPQCVVCLDAVPCLGLRHGSCVHVCTCYACTEALLRHYHLQQQQQHPPQFSQPIAVTSSRFGRDGFGAATGALNARLGPLASRQPPSVQLSQPLSSQASLQSQPHEQVMQGQATQAADAGTGGEGDGLGSIRRQVDRVRSSSVEGAGGSSAEAPSSSSSAAAAAASHTASGAGVGGWMAMALAAWSPPGHSVTAAQQHLSCPLCRQAVEDIVVCV